MAAPHALRRAVLALAFPRRGRAGGRTAGTAVVAHERCGLRGAAAAVREVVDSADLHAGTPLQGREEGGGDAAAQYPRRTAQRPPTPLPGPHMLLQAPGALLGATAAAG